MQKRTRRTLFVLAAVLVASAPLRSLAAQDARASIDPGMSREQVVERLGPPMGERTAGGFTYLFYRNGCERRCGMHDLVVLQDDGVTDAIFRSRARRYTGTSSSPSATAPSPAARDADATLEVDAGERTRVARPAPRQAPRIDAPRAGIGRDSAARRAPQPVRRPPAAAAAPTRTP